MTSYASLTACTLLTLGASATGVDAEPVADALDSHDVYAFIQQFFNAPTMMLRTGEDPTAARLGFVDEGVRVNAKFKPFVETNDGIFLQLENEVIAWSADKKVVWASADDVNRGSAMGGEPSPGWFGDWHHGVALLVPHGKKLQVIAYVQTTTLADSDQATALKAGAAPPKLERKIGLGAETVAKQFESTIGDPTAFAATVSDRKDVVLFGSSRTDRQVGGKEVAATLAKWNLKLEVRDRVQAGLASPTVAWVAANVDAVVATAKAGTKATPYQMFVLYEKTGDAWKVVQTTFAFFKPAA